VSSRVDKPGLGNLSKVDKPGLMQVFGSFFVDKPGSHLLSKPS
jgi:hypothetical protein